MKCRAICIMLVCVLAGCAAPPKNLGKVEAKARWEQMRAKVKRQLAERNFEGGQIDDALKICQEVLALDGASLDSYLLMARIQLEKGQMAAAEAALDNASGLGQDVPDLAYLRGMLAERREQMSDAFEWYQKAYEAKPSEVDYLVAYAESMLAAGQIDPAIELLTKRERDFEQEARVQVLFGQALALGGRHSDASDAYLSALRLTSTDPLLREEASLVLLAAKRVDEAQVVLEPLFATLKDHPSPAIVEALAGALLNVNRVDRATILLETAATEHPESFGINLLLGKAYLMLDKPRQAQEAAHRACRLKPRSAEARLLLAYSAFVAGNYDQAIATSQEIIAANPNDAEAISLLERVLKLNVAAASPRRDAGKAANTQ